MTSVKIDGAGWSSGARWRLPFLHRFRRMILGEASGNSGHVRAKVLEAGDAPHRLQPLAVLGHPHTMIGGLVRPRLRPASVTPSAHGASLGEARDVTGSPARTFT